VPLALVRGAKWLPTNLRIKILLRANEEMQHAPQRPRILYFGEGGGGWEFFSFLFWGHGWFGLVCKVVVKVQK